MAIQTPKAKFTILPQHFFEDGVRIIVGKETRNTMGVAEPTMLVKGYRERRVACASGTEGQITLAGRDQFIALRRVDYIFTLGNGRHRSILSRYGIAKDIGAALWRLGHGDLAHHLPGLDIVNQIETLEIDGSVFLGGIL